MHNPANSSIETAAVAVVIGIAAVAALAVFVSQSSSTAGVLGAAGSGLSQALCAATSPITGSSCGSSGYVSSWNPVGVSSSTINFGNV